MLIQGIQFFMLDSAKLRKPVHLGKVMPFSSMDPIYRE